MELPAVSYRRAFWLLVWILLLTGAVLSAVLAADIRDGWLVVGGITLAFGAGLAWGAASGRTKRRTFGRCQTTKSQRRPLVHADLRAKISCGSWTVGTGARAVEFLTECLEADNVVAAVLSAVQLPQPGVRGKAGA